MSDPVTIPDGSETVTPEAVAPPDDYLADISFEDLNLSPELRRAIADRGYVHPTPVQAKAFGPAMAGRDLIVRSKTGTGKTAAFGMPLLEKIAIGEREVKALVLCPTRELAIQVAAEIRDLAKYRDVKVTAIYGGASMKEQEDALEYGSAIVVGTPGRVYDHIRRKNLKLESATFAVLDEADEMLNQGFYEEVTRILDCLPKNRQVLLFSATVPEDIQKLIGRYTTDAETLLLSGDVYTVDHIKHVRFDVSDAYPKPRNLIYILEMEEPENAIIFCNTRSDTELVTAVLNRNGFDAELLNGDLPQKERERVMAKIKRGEVAFMVATDLAARGIDISDLGHVINYSLPEDPAVYLHRVGRTGRMSKKGVALNLMSGRELATFTALEKKYGIEFEKRPMPNPEEALKLWTDRHVREIQEAASGSVHEGLHSLAGQLKLRQDADDLIAFLIKYFMAHHRVEKATASGHEVYTPPPKSSSPPRHAEEGRRGGRERDGRRERGGHGGEREREARPPREARAPRAAVPQTVTATSEVAATVEGAANEVPAERGASQSPSAGARPRRERRPVEVTPVPPGQARLWVNLGKMDGLDEAGFKAALDTAGAPTGKLVTVELRGSYSYAFVADGDVGEFEAASGKKHGEKSIKIERAKR
ncbi:MAG: DEAD/DEAH box helicase [Myxococcaceae bacterium]